MLAQRREREHLRHTLDTVREPFDVRCGPLIHASDGQVASSRSAAGGWVGGEPVQQQIGHRVGLFVEDPVRDTL